MGRYNLKGIFTKTTFFLNQISGYALTHVTTKGKVVQYLHIGLADGQFFTIAPLYYRNYPDIEAALINGQSLDPIVRAKGIKKQQGQIFITYAAIMVIGMMLLIAYINSPKFEADDILKQWLIYLSMFWGILYVGWKYVQYARRNNNVKND